MRMGRVVMQFSQKTPGVLAGLLAAISIVATSAPLRAELIGYNFGISEDLHVLENFPNVLVSTTRSAQSLLTGRNTPYIELENLSTTARIVQLTVTIGNLLDNFDVAKAIDVPAGVTFSVSAPQTLSDGSGSDLVTINFTGFQPHTVVRFQLDIDVDSNSGNKLVDYRDVMFGMHSAPASVVTVKFDDPAGTVVTNSLLDFDSQAPAVVQALTLAEACRANNSDMVRAFEVPVMVTVEVPEPGSLSLLGLAMLGLALGAWRQRLRVRRRITAQASLSS